MPAAAKVKESVYPLLPGSIHGQAPARTPSRAAGIARSAKNILEWNSYLPLDCVKTMVRMGWDRTT